MPQPFATKPLGFPFVELQSVDSTNNYARQQIHAGLTQHGTAYFTHEQLAGKGQRGRVWTAEKDANILISLVINPHPIRLTNQFQLNACIAVGVQRFFAKYAGSDTKIKWPNDLYWQDRKAGGILIENIVRGKSSQDDSNRDENTPVSEWVSIAGIGININQAQFPADLKNPVSLRQITGKTFDPVTLAKELCKELEAAFGQLQHNGFDALFNEYNQVLYKAREKVKFKKDGRVFEAIVLGISMAGKLLIQHSMMEEIDFGAVEWVV